MAAAILHCAREREGGGRVEALVTHARQRELGLQVGQAIFLGFSEFKTYAAASLPGASSDDYTI